MDAQELLTYIEDLTFKKSMRGYDANEVDDQLDRICDEIEAIARDKDAEIASLRKSVELSAKGMVSQELAKTKAHLAEANKKLAAAEEKLFQAEARAAAAEQRAEEGLREAAADVQADVAPVVSAAEAEAQEAYKQYVRNADLLCKQLDALDAKENEIITNAQNKADEILDKARADAENIIGKANIDAENLIKDAQAKKEAFEALAEQKDGIIAQLRAIAEDTGALVDKHIEKVEADVEEVLGGAEEDDQEDLTDDADSETEDDSEDESDSDSEEDDQDQAQA